MPSKKKELTHLVQLVVVFFLAVILRYSDPLTQNVAGVTSLVLPALHLALRGSIKG